MWQNPNMCQTWCLQWEVSVKSGSEYLWNESQIGGRETQIGGREKCDFCVYNMEEKLVFPVDTCYLCVSDSNDVPNPVVWMHFWREKRLQSRIGRSEGLRSTNPLSRASGFGKLTRSDLGPIKKWNCHHHFCHQHHFLLQKFSMFESNFDHNSNFQFLNFQVAGILSVCE